MPSAMPLNISWVRICMTVLASRRRCAGAGRAQCTGSSQGGNRRVALSQKGAPAGAPGRSLVCMPLFLHWHHGCLLLVVRIGVNDLAALDLAEHRHVRGDRFMVGLRE